jgi:CAAX prenyl protease-like protein
MVVLALRGALSDHLDTRWLYVIQAGGAALVLALLWPRYVELRRSFHVEASPWSWLRTVAMAVLLGVLIAAMWVFLNAPWMRIGDSINAFVPTDASGRLEVSLIAMRLAGACLVVPLMEELFWRSFIMRWLDDRDFLRVTPQQGSLFALVASSAVFALAHVQWLAAFIAGLLFAAIYRFTGQLWGAVLAHAVANLALGIYVIYQGAWAFW